MPLLRHPGSTCDDAVVECTAIEGDIPVQHELRHKGILGHGAAIQTFDLQCGQGAVPDSHLTDGAKEEALEVAGSDTERGGSVLRCDPLVGWIVVARAWAGTGVAIAVFEAPSL